MYTVFNSGYSILKKVRSTVFLLCQIEKMFDYLS